MFRVVTFPPTFRVPDPSARRWIEHVAFILQTGTTLPAQERHQERPSAEPRVATLVLSRFSLTAPDPSALLKSLPPPSLGATATANPAANYRHLRTTTTRLPLPLPPCQRSAPPITGVCGARPKLLSDEGPPSLSHHCSRRVLVTISMRWWFPV